MRRLIIAVFLLLVPMAVALIVIGVNILRAPQRIRDERYPHKLAAATQPLTQPATPGEMLIAQQFAIQQIRWEMDRERRYELSVLRRPVGILLIVLGAALTAAWSFPALWLALSPHSDPSASGRSDQTPPDA